MISADRIDRWASETVGADAIFPELIRRLVHALNDTLTLVDIPSGTSIRLGGWDGLTSATVATSFVPEGDAAWECSVEATPTSKANGDYEKRTANPLGLIPAQSTYIFCTPRKWPAGKKTWAKGKCAEGKWKEVRAVDAHELATLFERAPAVRDWFMRQLGLSPPGSFAASDWLSDYLHATNPPLDGACLLLNHKAARQSIVDFILASPQPPKPLSVIARTTQDAVAFCIAALCEVEAESQRLHAISRALVVENTDAWKVLTAISFTRLILIPNFSLTETDLGRARNHRVVIASSSHSELADTSSIDTQVSEGNNHLLADKLTALGMNPFRADRLVAECRGRITVVRKHLLVASVAPPTWSAKEYAALIAPFLLCGGWAHDNEHDVAVVSQITGLSAAQIESTVSQWSGSSPPLFKTQKTAVQLDAVGEAWMWLATAISSAAWERFFEIAKQVLSEINPKYELPADERWLANIRGKVPKYSGLLSTGLSEALVRLSVETRMMQLTQGFNQNGSCVEYQCRKLFDENSEKERFLYSVATDLPIIAEAAPDAFLAALQRDLSGPRHVEKMFESNGWHGSSGHASLLWALEHLAWSKDHFTLAVRMLASLCVIQLPENVGNTPFGSLASIFRGWQVATSISFAERTTSLDALFTSNEDVAWRLTLSLLPHWGGASLVPTGPRFRDWADDAPKSIRNRDYMDYCHEVLIIACREAPNRTEYCIALLERLFNHHAIEQQLIVSAVEKFVANRPRSDTSTTSLWIAIKKSLYGRRAKEADEDTESVDVNIRLRAMHDALVPHDLPSQFAWLFANAQMDLPMPTSMHIWSDWKARELEARVAQSDAISKLAIEGLGKVLDTASQCENVWLFGVLVAESGLLDVNDVVPLLESVEDSHKQFASAFINAHARKPNDDSALLSPEALARLPIESQLHYLVSLSATLATFTYVAAQPEALAKKYWATTNFQWIDEDAHTHAAREYLRANKPLNAINVLNLHLDWKGEKPALCDDGDAQLVHDVLFAAFRMGLTDEEVAKRFGSEAYHMSQLMIALAESNFDREKVGQLEFNFLPVGRNLHGWRPSVLLDEIGKSHEQFCELLKLAYKRDDGTIEDGDRVSGVAANAWQLLDQEAWYPANQQGEDAAIAAIHEWIKSALKLASDSNRSQIAAQLIAKALGRLGRRSGSNWPNDAMAELLEALHSESFVHDVIHGEMYGFGRRSIEVEQDAERAIELDRRADQIRLVFPHTVMLLRKLAREYRHNRW